MIAAVLGWTGTVGTFVAYVMVTRGHLSVQSRRYAALNGIGGLLAATGSVIYGAWPSVASNVVWAAIGFWTLVAATRERRRGLATVVPLDRPPTPEPSAALAA